MKQNMVNSVIYQVQVWSSLAVIVGVSIYIGASTFVSPVLVLTVIQK